MVRCRTMMQLLSPDGGHVPISSPGLPPEVQSMTATLDRTARASAAVCGRRLGSISHKRPVRRATGVGTVGGKDLYQRSATERAPLRTRASMSAGSRFSYGRGPPKTSKSVIPALYRSETLVYRPFSSSGARKSCVPAAGTDDPSGAMSAALTGWFVSAAADRPRSRLAGPAMGYPCGTATRCLPVSDDGHRICCPACPHLMASPIRQPPRTHQKSHPFPSPVNRRWSTPSHSGETP
jgi:hypothetical protein